MLFVISFRAPDDPKDAKVEQGWLVVAALVLVAVHWCAWNLAFFFVGSRVKAPDYLLEAVEGHQPIPQHSAHDIVVTPE